MSRRSLLYLKCATALLPFTMTSTSNATWSIVMADTSTKEVAAGTVTCLNAFDLLALVPVIVVGKGAAAVQSAGDFDGLRRPIIFDTLRSGVPPETILAIVAGIQGHQDRQYGIVDTKGGKVTFTGTGDGPWAGGVVGTDGSIVYAIQGNVLTGPCVVAAIEQAILTTTGDMPAKLLAGMQAAGSKGGDGRCSCTTGGTQSCGCPPAAFTKPGHIGGMVVARVGDVDDPVCNGLGCTDGDYFMRLNVPFQLQSDPDPVLQLTDLFNAWRAGLVGRPDGLQTVVSFNPPGPVPNGTSTTMRITPLDWQGLPTSVAIQSITVEHASDSDGVSTIGPVVDNGDGSFSVTLTSSTLAARTDRFKIVIDDGIRPVTLAPEPALALEAPVPTDDCALAPTVTEGLFPFSTLGATTDGPDEPVTCNFSGDSQVSSDVWACYTPAFTGPVTASLCGSGYNTKIAVYLGCAVCPTTASALACNDDACGGALQSEISFDVAAGQDYLVRIGGFGADQGSGALTITRHLEACCLPDGSCQDVRAADCLSAGGSPGGAGTTCAATQCPPSPPQPELIRNGAGTMVLSAKNRFLSFSAGDPGRFQAVRVTLVSLPPPFDAWNGVQLFVQEPFEASEVPSKGFNEPPDAGDDTFLAARLGCAPFFTDWSALGVVHAFHEGIVPSSLVTGGGAIDTPAEYDIQLIDISGSLAVEADFGTPLRVTTSGWGDLVEISQGEFVAPDNTVSVFDTVGLLQAFTGFPGAPVKVRTELLGSTETGPDPTVDGKITVNELIEVIGAFRGGTYPFVPGPRPCQ